MAERKYRYKDVDMLSASAILVENAITHQPFLVSKRSTWADPFFPDLQTRIDAAFSDYLGIDNAKDQREATNVVLEVQEVSLELLAEFKVQEDFKDEPKVRDEILNVLGFAAHHSAAQNRDQEALVELLMKFKKNMVPALKSEITAKGMAVATIDSIETQADILNKANINQETLKRGRKVVTAGAVEEFNAIYDEVISIGRIAANFFKKEPEKQEQFHFSNLVESMNSFAGEEDEASPPGA